MRLLTRHLFQPGGLLGGRCAGRGVDELAVGGLDKERLVRGAEEQATVAQRFQHQGSRRRAARGHLDDAGLDLVEIIARKPGESRARLRLRLSASSARDQNERQ
jgi:hypothetical protein